MLMSYNGPAGLNAVSSVSSTRWVLYQLILTSVCRNIKETRALALLS